MVSKSHSYRIVLLVLLGGAVTLAFAGARPYAGGWNDGSRLAAVEAIADHQAFAIDHSIFVTVPKDAAILPYAAADTVLIEYGTKDKMLVRGQYFSDKPPVVSVLMAGLYRVLQTVGLPQAADRPDLFCRAMTWCTSGIAFVVALVCMYRFASIVGLSSMLRLGLIASLGLCTVALTYTRHVNSHILLLAAMAGLMLHVIRAGIEARDGVISWVRLAFIGNLAGLAYNLDLGAGPVLLICLIAWVGVRFRRIGVVLLLLVAAAPWLLAHHVLNFAIGGVWSPVNTVPEYMNWPGSPFNAENLTGFWRHHPLKFVVYALALLFGKHGFIGHNLPLFLMLLAGPVLWRRRPAERPELIFGLAWCLGTWITYAGFSNNYGGACCSVRWFVPFLAPAYCWLAVFLRYFPEYRRDFLILSICGGVLSTIMWVSGPWATKMVAWFWPIQATALLGWAVWRYLQRPSLHETGAIQPAISSQATLAA